MGVKRKLALGMLGLAAAVGAALAVLRVPGYPDGTLDVRADIAGPSWSVLAVEYARSHGVEVRRLVAGAAPGEPVDMSWAFVVAVGHGQVLLVDTGTDELAEHPHGERARKWSIARARPVVAALAAVGLRPDDVTDVVLTHRHWDHADGLVRFGAGARIIAHPAEWAALREHAGRELGAVLDAVERRGAFVPVTAEGLAPLPGVEVRELGHHTAHHVVVELRCGERTIIAGGDSAYLFRNLEQHLATTENTTPEANLRDLETLLAHAGPTGIVLPGHDPELFARYPTPIEGVARVCPR